MKLLLLAVLTIQSLSLTLGNADSKLICYYDSTAYLRQGLAKMDLKHMEMALNFCTHLVYGYAGLKSDTFEIFSLNPDLDSYYYGEVILVRKRFPDLKILLSIGGDHDKYVTNHAEDNKYIRLLEANRTTQQNFIDSSMLMLKRNGFDGLDLAFQFPKNKPRKVHGTFGSYWKKFKKLFTGNFVVDPWADDHKGQYTSFVANLRSTFQSASLMLTMTVLPNVNSSWYFDVPKLHHHFDYINLAAFDFLTPIRNPDEADYTAPIYFLDGQNRQPHLNTEFQVNYWIENQCPTKKLNLGIATYGRAWKLTKDSPLSGLPVIHYASGPSPGGLQIASTEGLLSWPEICSKLATNHTEGTYRGENAPLRKVSDLEHKYGNYAYRPSDNNGDHGLWVSFDDPDFAGIKANYARNKELGGVALFDLTYDDFRGLCTGQKFPIVRSVKYLLN